MCRRHFTKGEKELGNKTDSANVGIVLFSKRCKYLKSLYTINENKLKLFSSELDVSCLKAGLQVFDKICLGNKEGGAIANMDIPDRFRWLTAVKRSCIQVSRPHPGFSTDLDKMCIRDSPRCERHTGIRASISLSPHVSAFTAFSSISFIEFA